MKKAGFDEVLKVLELSEFDFDAISQGLEDFSDKDVVVVHLGDAEIEEEMNEIVKLYGSSPHKTGAFGVSTMSKGEAMSKPPCAGDDGLFKRIRDVLSSGKRAIVWHRKKVTIVQGVQRS